MRKENNKMVKKIKPKDCQILVTLIEKYSFTEVKEAIKIVYQNNPESWLYIWSKSSLKRSDFWILWTMKSRYSYRQMINAIEDIERFR